MPTTNDFEEYTMINHKKYEKINASIKLLAELTKSEQEIRDNVALIPQEDIDKEFSLT